MKRTRAFPRARADRAFLVIALFACGSESTHEEAPQAAVVAQEETPGEGEPTEREPSLPEGVATPEPNNEAQRAREDEGGPMARARWLSSFSAGYVQLACREDYFFRTCFEGASAAECANSMRAAVRRCARDRRVGLGARVGSAEESAQISERLSACAGETYENMLTEAGRRLHNGRCDNPSAWAGGR